MLSRYRILSKLGAGGMGVVYRAEDISLKRPVALKFLSASSLSEEQTRARFLREAQTAAALNHPNVCTIYEVGEVRGDEEEALGTGAHLAPGTPFIAMELIEGRTLEAMVRQSGSLPFDDLLGISLQVADGMAAAHARGIVHRDLKPGNVMVTKEGRVKILDFGLAKPLEPAEPGDTAGTAAATASAELTREGRVIGTAAYMSPEQAKGEHVDSRSDIFSFGVMLYELATGTRPFRGTTTLSTLAKIIEAEPEPIPDSRADIPQELRRIVRRCLQKKPEDRYNDTRDLVAALKALLQETTSGAPKMASGAVAAAPSLARRRGLWLTAALLLLVAAAAAVAWRLGHHGAVATQAQPRFQSMRIRRVQGIAGGVFTASLSPDGKFLAYATMKDGKYGLTVRQISTGSDIRILSEHTPDILSLTYSRTGEYLYFHSTDPGNDTLRHLYRVPALGGMPRRVLTDIDSPPALSPDGRAIAFVRNYPTELESSLIVAQADGTGERKLAVKKFPMEYTSGLAWSPDGTRIASLLQSSAGESPLEIVEIGVDDGKESRPGSSRWKWVTGLEWLSDGSGLVLAGGRAGDPKGQVWFVSHADARVSRITNDTNHYFRLSVSADSTTLATLQTHVTALDLWAAPADDPNAAKVTSAGGTGGEDAPVTIASTPSGSIVFETLVDETGIWSMAPDGSDRRRLTPDGLDSRAPLVARAAGTIVFTAHRADGIDHVWKVDPDGGTPLQLTQGDGEKARAISPDGARLVFKKSGEEALWKMRLDGGAPTRIGVPMPEGRPPLYSPDGKYLWVYTYKGSGTALRTGFDQYPSDGGAPVRWVERARACNMDSPGFRLTPSGDALACIGLVDSVLNIWAQPLAGGEAQPITRFKSGHVMDFDWSKDGKQLFMSRGDFASDIVLITDFK